MRKTLAIILAVAMIASVTLCFVITSSASDPTPITTAEEFAAMNADGIYILKNDITLSATYTTAFTGSFDGDGKTITTTVPLFSAMNGTVKNLVITGAVTGDGSLGALACTTKSESAVFDNIINKATVTSTVAAGSDAAVGGIIGYVQNNGVAPITIKNCVNEGNVTGPEATGGIAGEAQMPGTTFENCTNKGTITSLSTDSGTASGGILGYNGTGPVIVDGCRNEGELVAKYRAGGMIGDARKSATVKNCVNTGNVTAKDDGSKNTIAGGIIGYAVDGSTSETMPFLIENCVNTGKIDAYVEGKENGDAAGILGNGGASGAKIGAFKIVNSFNSGEITGGYRVGGIIGYAYGSATNQYADIENCINVGAIKAGRFGSQFIGYTNTPNTTIKNSIGAGTMTKNTAGSYINRLCVFGCSSADVELCIIENVVLVDGGATDWYTFANFSADETNAVNRIALSYVLGKDFSGVTYQYPTYSDDTYAVLKADNENTYTNTADVIATNITATSIIRAEAITQAMIDAVNTAIGSTKFYLDNGTVTLEAPTNPPVVTTTVPGATTTAPTATTTDPSAVTTTAPNTTTPSTPNTTTAAPSGTTAGTDEGGCGGCGGIAVFVQIIALVCGAAAFIVIKRK